MLERLLLSPELGLSVPENGDAKVQPFQVEIKVGQAVNKPVISCIRVNMLVDLLEVQRIS